MQKGLFVFLVSLLAMPFPIKAQAAPVPLEVRLICYDMLVYPASLAISGGVDNRFSSQGRFAPPNDELALAPFGNPTTHWGTFFFSFAGDDPIPMNFELDIPWSDNNDNGVEDILEYGQAVSTVTTSGTYIDGPFGDGDFRATWTKAANSQTGTCRILYDFLNQAFVHTFEILNYEATWSSAVKQNSTVHGPITLRRLGTPTSTLSGELELSLAQQGDVRLVTKTLKDENEAIFQWADPQTMDRDRTEFYEFLTVNDGWLYEPTSDFWDWLIIVDDKNDGDGDGIPDLIDPPAVTATAPTMQIIKTENGVRLMISGDVGRAYTLEDAPGLPAAQWLHPTTVTLTANPHVIDLPAPATQTFWRMRFP